MKPRKSLNIETEAWIVYGLLQNLQYEIYYALAEYVDNSVQSFLDNKKILKNKFVTVSINFGVDQNNQEYIEIIDDAGGISEDRFDDAFRLADPDGFGSTLNEFGLGMKMASLWLGNKFTVKTSAIGEKYATTVIFDLDYVQKAKVNHIDGDNLFVEKESASEHYTIITIEKMRNFPRGGMVNKLKTHLSDIYRTYLRESNLNLLIQGQRIDFNEPDWLFEPYWDDSNGPFKGSLNKDFQWKKDFHFKLPAPYDYAKGHIGLHTKMQRTTSGLVMFRRGRAVYGTGDERYRPSGLFGPSQSQKYARLFAEVHVGPNSPVSSNKRLVWNEVQSIFVLEMKKMISGDFDVFKSFLAGDIAEKNITLSEILPINRMGTSYRSTKAKKISDAKLQELAESATKTTTDVFKEIKGDVDPLIANPVHPDNKKANDTSDDRSLSIESINVNFSDEDWHFTFKILKEASRPLYIFKKTDAPNSIELSINIEHPFIRNFIDKEGQIMTAFLRIASGLALSEIISEQTQNTEASSLRNNFNSIMSGSLSRKK